MPKSRFNAIRERARATRHNPAGRKGESNGHTVRDSTNSTSIVPSKDDAIPILNSLPLEGTQAVNQSEILWALTSLTSFVSDKPSRVQLLSPQHKFIARVVLQLNSQNDYQIRDAASGCLRNLCIEAGGKACKVLEEQRCVQLCIKEILLAAEKVGIRQGKSNQGIEVMEAPAKKEDLSTLLGKPQDKLNRKEKRQLAKLEASSDKKKNESKDLVMDDVITSDQSNVAKHPLNVERNVDDEQFLLCCSHMTNLIAILWCLVEVSPQALDLCRRSAFILTNIFSICVSKAIKSIESLSQSRQGTENLKVNGRVDVGKKDEVEKDKAMIQLALTALNALVTLTDSDQEISAAFMGISKERLRSSLKGTKKSFIVEDESVESEFLNHGPDNVEALSEAILTLKHLLGSREQDRGGRALQRQVTSLALLSLATFRNVQSCLPDNLRNHVEVVDPKAETQGDGQSKRRTIGGLEMELGLQCLTQVLKQESNDKIEGVFGTLNADNESHELSREEKQAEEEVNNLSLALEILAELAGDREGWSGQGDKSAGNEQVSDTILIDEEVKEEEEGEGELMQEDSNDEDDNDDDDLLEEDLLDEVEGKQNNAFAFDQSRISSFFSPELVEALLSLSVLNQGGFAEISADQSKVNSNVAASLRSIAIRALSALNNQCLVLASFAQLPPSQPPKTGNVIKSFYNWLEISQDASKKQKNGELLSRMWRWLFEYASRIATLPCLGNFEDVSSVTQDARKVMELCLCIMWSLGRCYEGVEGSDRVLLITASDFTKDAFCSSAQSSSGVVDSLIAAYKISKKTKSGNQVSEGQETTSSVQLAPTLDGIRTHSLGILTTLVRQPYISMIGKEKIVALLIDVLDVLPSATDLNSRLNTLGIQDSTSPDAMIVAINGIIDTFANEESSWDSLYSKLRLQSRLKRASVDVKSASRTVDKRKQPALRASADEAWKNLIDFLQYRASLV